MKFDLVNLQQRVKKSFEPMRPITAKFISSQPWSLPHPQPSRGRMFTVSICHQAVSKETKWGIKGKVSGKG